MKNIVPKLKILSPEVPVILQSEMTECGLACLAMVGSYLGHKVSLSGLRLKFPPSSRGLSLANLITMASKVDLVGRPLQLDLDDLKNLNTPCVLHWGHDHFVVLTKVNSKYICIHDPARGHVKVQMDEVSRKFTGIALELTRTDQFKPLDLKPKIELGQFIKGMTGLRRGTILLLGLSVVLMLITTISPLYFQFVVDEVLVSHDANFLNLLAIGFGALLLFKVTVSYLRQQTLLYISQNISYQAEVNIFRHLIRLPVAYFSKRHLGDVISRFDSFRQIQESLTNQVVTSIIDGVFLILMMVLIFLYSVKLSVLVLGVAAIYTCAKLMFYRLLRDLQDKSLHTEAQSDSIFMETIRAIEDVKLYGKEDLRQTTWSNKRVECFNANTNISRLKMAFDLGRQFLFGSLHILIIYVGASMVLEAQFSVGMLVAFLAYQDQFIQRFSSLIDGVVTFKMTSLHMERLSDILLSKTESRYKTEGSKKVTKGKISLDNVSFRYSEDEDYIFENASLTINPGEKVALIGPSGSGKSTLSRVMLGILQQDDGNVQIDDTPTNEMGEHLFSEVATVMQDGQLLSGSLMENIAFFDQNMDMDRVVECAKIACIHETIKNLPMGYSSLVGDMGTTLSGGQKQRILLARALYKKPKILLLDEATSSLDLATEAAISKNIDSLNITRIVIAHRPETIKNVDRSFIVDGSIQEVIS